MAIIIPSKHIYSINNSKVIDNQVDKIEVQSKRVVPDNRYGVPVYNERLSLDSKYVGTSTQDFAVGYQPNGTAAFVLAGIKFIPTYAPAQIKIPITKENSYIETLILGVDNNGNNNIGIRLFGDVSKGEAKSTYKHTGFHAEQGYPAPFSKEAFEINWNETVFVEKEHFESDYVLKTKTTQDYEREKSVFAYPKAIAYIELSLNNDENLATVNAEKENDYYILNVTVLCGLKIIKLGLETGNPINVYDGGNLDGKYEEYIPSLCEISFKGNIIGIDLEDKVVTINNNGKFPMSFDGNELMQDTNTPSVEETYEKVIKEWESGKEVATIKCGIEDYYDPLRQKNIDINITTVAPSVNVVIFTTNYDLKNVDKLYLDSGEILTSFSPYNKENEWISSQEKINETLSVGEHVATIKRKSISNKGENALPMTFHIGDIVIPYVYGAMGKDKPMSIYKNGRAKEFEILGKKMIYDGGIWQEISIQEAIPESYEVTIRLGQPTITNYPKATQKVFVIEGKLDVGNTIKYKGYEAEVVEYNSLERYYLINCVAGDVFYTNFDKTITVTKN